MSVSGLSPLRLLGSMPGASDSTGCASVEPRKLSRLFDSHGPYAVARNVVALLATGGNLWLCVFALRNEPWSWSRIQEHPPSAASSTGPAEQHNATLLGGLCTDAPPLPCNETGCPRGDLVPCFELRSSCLSLFEEARLRRWPSLPSPQWR